MMRIQDALAAQWRGWCCIREEMKRTEGIWSIQVLEEQDKAKRDGEGERENVLEKEREKERKCKDASHPQFRSALQSIIRFTWENLQAPREWGGFVSDRRILVCSGYCDINLERRDNEEDFKSISTFMRVDRFSLVPIDTSSQSRFDC